MKNQIIRNRISFGLGTTGRDMVYALVSMYLIYYLTDILKLPDATIIVVTNIMLGARIFDALNDPFMGTVVDSTHTRWGKFKPWILFGVLTSAVLTVLLFTDFGLTGTKYTILFAVVYILWGIAFTTNDISYWSMMPSLSENQNEREKIGSIARICAQIGLFFVVAAFQPITEAISEALGGDAIKAWNIYALSLSLIMIAFQLITVFGVKEPHQNEDAQSTERTSIRGMAHAIFKNDQLLYVAIAMTLFMTAYTTTTEFGVYYFKYFYGDEGMYSLFAIVLGVSQITSTALFPQFSKKASRKKLYVIAISMVSAGYILFFFAPANMIPIVIAGILVFFAEAIVQLLVLLFLADTVEYGEWKLGKRNESVTFSLQPFINKFSGAVASGVTGYVIVWSGINKAETAADVTSGGILMLKVAMFAIPLVAMIAGFIVYLKHYKLDKETYEKILSDLDERKKLK